MATGGPSTSSTSKALLKQAFRTGSIESFHTILNIVLESFRDESQLPEIRLAILYYIKKYLNPDKDANSILNCLSLVSYLITNGHRNLKTEFWDGEIEILVGRLRNCSKQEVLGGDVGKVIREKALEVQQAVMFGVKGSDQCTDTEEDQPTGTVCPKCEIPIDSIPEATMMNVDRTELLFLGECENCDYIFCTNCKMDFHGVFECGLSSDGFDESPYELRERMRAEEFRSISPANESTLIRHCPKCQSNTLEAAYPLYLHCTKCEYIFCRNCNENYHGIFDCAIDVFDMKELLLNLNVRDDDREVNHIQKQACSRGFDDDDEIPVPETRQNMFTCNTCGDVQNLAELAKFECQHEACKNCVKGYFSIQINEGNVQGLKCLQDGCEVKATESLVRLTVDFAEYTRYEEFLLDEALADCPEIVNCPNSNCQRRVNTSDGIFGHCETCDYRFCTACSLPYHGLVECGKSDSEVRREVKAYLAANERRKREIERQEEENRQRREREAEQLISRTCKKCPGCRANIEKNEGCHHMQCTKCNTHFCWLCLQIISSRNPHEHFNKTNCPLFNVPADI